MNEKIIKLQKLVAVVLVDTVLMKKGLKSEKHENKTKS